MHRRDVTRRCEHEPHGVLVTVVLPYPLMVENSMRRSGGGGQINELWRRFLDTRYA